MMRRVFTVVAGLVVAVGLSAGGAAQGGEEQRAFEHYERIRSALAADSVKGVPAEARALAPLAREIAGEAAGTAAAALAEATNIESAREQFGVLSEALVPGFLKAGLPGVQGFVCPMKQKRWVQRGSTAANPYYGKAMPTCGTPVTVTPR